MRRAESRRRLVWVAIGAAVVLVAVATITIVASPIFDVRVVQVQGATYTDADVLQSVIDDLEGEPVLLVDTQAAEATLEAVPWVESARVQTDFPHTVVIDIRERRAIATFQGTDGRFRVIDVQGRVLDVIDNQPIDYTLVVGANPDSAPTASSPCRLPRPPNSCSGCPTRFDRSPSRSVSTPPPATSRWRSTVVAGTTVPVRHRQHQPRREARQAAAAGSPRPRQGVRPRRLHHRCRCGALLSAEHSTLAVQAPSTDTPPDSVRDWSQ